MPPAARVTDMHICPMVTGVVPHVGGPILPPGVPTVLIDFLPAATVTDMATCVGPPDVIIMGSGGVFINFLPAARLGDPTTHGGVIVMGSPTCIIGEVGSPSPSAAGLGLILSGLVVAGVMLPAIFAPELLPIEAEVFENYEVVFEGLESKVGSSGIKNASEEAIAGRIANGHAFDKHANDFGAITRDKFKQKILETLMNPSETRLLSNDRTAYWNENRQMMVIKNPNTADGGTAFKPTAGKTYFNKLR